MAKAKNIGNIYAELSVKDKMSMGISKATKSLKAFGNISINVLGPVGKLAAAISGIGIAAGGAMAAGMTAGTGRALKLVAGLDDLSKQTGIAVADTMKLNQAYKLGGVSADRMGADVAKMQKAIVTAAGGGKDPFESMGLSAANLLALNPAEQFRQIGDAIMAIKNPAERNAKAMEVFGKSGAKLATVFSDFEGAAKSLGRMPELAQKFSSAMEEADDIISDRLPGKADQFFVGFTSGVIGQMLPALRKLDEHDFTTLGENLGIELSNAMQSLTDGTLWRQFEIQGQIAIEKLRTGSSGIQGFANAWAAAINAVLDFGATGEFNFDKYAQAGIEAGNERISELSSELEKIRKDAAKAAAERRSAVQSDPQETSVAKPITVEVAKTAATEKAFDWQAGKMEVDEYQRRGLSMSADGGAAQAKRSIDYLAKIADILGKAKLENRALVWGQ